MGSRHLGNGGAPFIKQEPEDDTNMIDLTAIPDVDETAAPDDSMFVDEETAISSRRAKNAEGKPFETVCFEQPYVNHPHHHHLRCGHDIMTDKILPCGGNCEPSKKAESKSKGNPFDCPMRECRAVNAALIRRDPKTRQVIRPRNCTLSHVYGRDEAADDSRRKEKEDLALEGLAGTDINRRVHYSMRPIARKRSVSPSPRNPKAEPKARKSPKKSTGPDMGGKLNKLVANYPSYEPITRFTGPGTKETVNGKFKTQKDFEADAKEADVYRTFGGLGVSSAKDRADSERQATKKALAEQKEFGEPSRPFGEGPIEHTIAPLKFECDNPGCGKQIHGVRHHCFHCDDFDLCEPCFEKREHPEKHRFKLLTNPAELDDVSNFPLKASFCQCQATTTEYLVLCAGCDEAFHPGCIGRGLYAKATYQADSDMRERALREDWEEWKVGKELKCLDCGSAELEALVQAGKDDVVGEQHGKRLDPFFHHHRQVQKRNKSYTPQQRAQKEEELSNAMNDDEKKAIEDKWDAIMDVQIALEEAEDGQSHQPDVITSNSRPKKRKAGEEQDAGVDDTSEIPVKQSKRSRMAELFGEEDEEAEVEMQPEPLPAMGASANTGEAELDFEPEATPEPMLAPEPRFGGDWF